MLLKSKAYVELAYMTGILPIANRRIAYGTQESKDSFVDASGESLQAVFPADASYSDGSELNMFVEYGMATSERFSGYFGFSEKEVDGLFETYRRVTEAPRLSRSDLRDWYDGYHTAAGDRLYNPRSIVCALENNQIKNYWTSSGIYDSIIGYVKDNVADIRDDLAILFAGGGVAADIQEYAAVSRQLETKDEIYSAMVVYGLLTYENGEVMIPNRELMCGYASMMKKEEGLGYINRLARESARMLKATFAKDTETMAAVLKYAHDTESPIFSYNSEIELSAVVNLVYLSARDKYRVEREDKAGEGYVDFIFYPDCRSDNALILELKVDSSPEEAIRQIKEKKYILRLKGKLGEKPKYTGKVFLAGITYDRKTKEHKCLVEVADE